MASHGTPGCSAGKESMTMWERRQEWLKPLAFRWGRAWCLPIEGIVGISVRSLGCAGRRCCAYHHFVAFEPVEHCLASPKCYFYIHIYPSVLDSHKGTKLASSPMSRIRTSVILVQRISDEQRQPLDHRDDLYCHGRSTYPSVILTFLVDAFTSCIFDMMGSFVSSYDSCVSIWGDDCFTLGTSKTYQALFLYEQGEWNRKHRPCSPF